MLGRFLFSFSLRAETVREQVPPVQLGVLPAVRMFRGWVARRPQVTSAHVRSPLSLLRPLRRPRNPCQESPVLPAVLGPLTDSQPPIVPAAFRARGSGYDCP
jgi:hypothetical protein